MKSRFLPLLFAAVLALAASAAPASAQPLTVSFLGGSLCQLPSCIHFNQPGGWSVQAEYNLFTHQFVGDWFAAWESDTPIANNGTNYVAFVIHPDDAAGAADGTASAGVFTSIGSAAFEFVGNDGSSLQLSFELAGNGADQAAGNVTGVVYGSYPGQINPYGGYPAANFSFDATGYEQSVPVPESPSLVLVLAGLLGLAAVKLRASARTAS